MAESGSISDHAASERCFMEWMKLQEDTQGELFEALNAVQNRASSNQEETERELTKLVDKSIEQFQDYIDRRMQLAKKDVSAFFAPVWCSARETSLLWIAGCRPSVFIRLAYSLTGHDLETRLMEFLQGMKSMEELAGELSPKQMEQLDSLQRRTIKEEERLTSELARVQEEMVDQTVVGIAMKTIKEKGGSEELERALEKQDGELLRLIQQADRLRIRTLNEVTEIFRPLQAVWFLAISKKLHLSVREWGQQSDRRHGRFHTP
ncbi:protein DELAY OF GERMINATION 1-like [Benincasa hispida]|uniref:protein DELAY OF GERMINATION 1-like n=1 Tax=Benincasa hispida TaxID=102211 RepID=UPI0018FFE16D|nr:protein DELAY OF GERMINATION 1-like [Benincasa hispida]